MSAHKVICWPLRGMQPKFSWVTDSETMWGGPIMSTLAVPTKDAKAPPNRFVQRNGVANRAQWSLKSKLGSYKASAVTCFANGYVYKSVSIITYVWSLSHLKQPVRSICGYTTIYGIRRAYLCFDVFVDRYKNARLLNQYTQEMRYYSLERILLRSG